MKIFEIILEFFKASVWPISLLIIFYNIRKPLVNLIPIMKQFKIKGFEFEFGDKVSELSLELQDTEDKFEDKYYISDDILNLINTSPKAAVLLYYNKIEDELKRFADQKNFFNLNEIDGFPLKLAAKLNEAELISKDLLEFFRKLRILRNEVKHYKELNLSKEDAIEFIYQCNRFKHNLVHKDS